MKKMILTVLLLFVSGCGTEPVYLETVPDEPYVVKVKLPSYSVRLLIMKHCPDDIADIDASEAVQAANIARQNGLTIDMIGNYHIDKNGRTNSWGSKINLDDLAGLKRFISAQMKVSAEAGDTIVVYTIGHGSGNGYLMRLGQRSNLMRAIAESAEENDQRTFWWQLSCHAAANLPSVSSLTPKQQELFTMTASSPAKNELSYFKTQGKQFRAMFSAMASESQELDLDGDGIIVSGELSAFLTSKFGEKRGKLLFSRSNNEIVFGVNWANQIPILDHNNPQGEYPRNYIPSPRRK